MASEDATHPSKLEREPSPLAGLPSEGKALTWLALLGLVGILWVALPVATGVLLGVLMAFSAQSFFDAARRHIKRPALAALLTVALSALLVVLFVGGLGYIFVSRGTVLGAALVPAFSGERAAGLLSKIDQPLQVFGISHAMLVERLRSAVESLGAVAARWAEHIASGAAHAMLALFLAVLTMQIVLPRWSWFARRAQLVLPLRPEYTRELIAEFYKIGRATLLGTVLTGILQGALATIGYFIAGVPEPLFFGVATTIAAFVPAIGTLLVWLPIGVALLLMRHVAAGVFELCWGVVVITGLSDYVIRPKLVGGEQFPTLVTFIALFGGVEVFGMEGLLLGPVIMALGISTVRIYAREAGARRTEPSASLPPSLE